MSKRRQKQKKFDGHKRKRPAQKIIEGLKEAIVHAAVHAASEQNHLAQPSELAMSLAGSVMIRATEYTKDKSKRAVLADLHQAQIAGMIDSALRQREYLGETSGESKGAEEMRVNYEDRIIDGFVSRVQYQLDDIRLTMRAPTMTISQIEAQTLARKLETFGYAGYKRAIKEKSAQHQWQVRMATDAEKAS